MTDPIADLLTRVRNAQHAMSDYVDIPASKFKADIARILAEQGYIEGYSVEPAPDEAPGEVIRIKLKYQEDRTPVLSGLRRVSRPGRRVYTDAQHIPKVLGGMGTSILSTSSGVMTGHEARQKGIGGEVVAQAW